MKKKILAICLVVALAATAIIGATLAYFTDTDEADNTFTVGSVKIELSEPSWKGDVTLLPGDKDTNNVAKDPIVTNVGSEDAYVRVHIAIPNVLDNGKDTFDAGKNVLHFNNSNGGPDKWNWSKSIGGCTNDGKGYPTDGKSWNYYESTIESVFYDVYVVTYETKLANGEATPAAMDQVYLDWRVSQSDIEAINEEIGNEWHILVYAEAVQAAGFDDAYTAFASSYAPIADGYVVGTTLGSTAVAP